MPSHINKKPQIAMFCAQEKTKWVKILDNGQMLLQDEISQTGISIGFDVTESSYNM